MTVPAIVNPSFRGTKNGASLSSGKLYTYESGSGTNKTTYSDPELLVANTNPIILDSEGQCDVYYTGKAKLVLHDSDDNLIDQWDNVATSGDINTEWVSSLTATYVSSTSFTVVGDQTSLFQVGRRIKTSTSVYGWVASSSYSDPNTTVTVTLRDADTIISGLSSVSVSITSAEDTSAWPLVYINRQTTSTTTLTTGVAAYINVSTTGVASEYDSLIYSSPSSESRFTVPAGFTHAELWFRSGFESGGSAGARQIKIEHYNSSDVLQNGQGLPEERWDENTYKVVTSQSFPIPVSSGDYFKLYLLQQSGGNLNAVVTTFAIRLYSTPTS